MKRLMAWFAGALVLAGGTFGTFALVETSMASAAPSAACLWAQQGVAQAELALRWDEALGSLYALIGPYERAQVYALIKRAEEQLQAAEITESIACRESTPTGSVSVTTGGGPTGSMSESVSVSESTPGVG